MREALKTYLRYTSWPIITAMIALIVIGVTAINVSQRGNPGIAGYSSRQIQYACVAVAAFICATLVPYHRLGRYAYVLFSVTLMLLVIVFFLPAIRGSHRWIDLKIMGIKVQPSEIAKLTYVILLAWYLRYGDNYRRLRGLVVPFALTFVPMGLILMEPDLGTSLLFLPTLYLMLFLAGAKLRHLLVIVALGAVVVLLPVPRGVDSEAFSGVAEKFKVTPLGPISFYHVDESLNWRSRPKVPVAYCRFRIGDGPLYDLQPLALGVMKAGGHQIGRIEGWLRQGDDDPAITMGKGYQLSKSKMILGAGGLTGREMGPDTRLHFRMLPDDHTDFIFAVVGGRWGFAGCVALLFLYGVIFLFGIEIAAITDDSFGRLLAVGVLALLFSQIVINVGMTMGLMPITGMTLPLVSYGGSSLVVNCASLGLLVNVGQHRPMLLGRRPFEHGDRKEKPPAPYGPLAATGDRGIRRSHDRTV